MDEQYTPVILKCTRHPEYTCESFSTDESLQNQSPLICICCILDLHIPITSIVIIKEVIDIKERRVLRNWPPLGDQGHQLIEKVIQLKQEEDNSDGLKLQICKFFDQFQEQANDTIVRVKKELLVQSDKYLKLDNAALEVYEQVSNIEKLKSLFQSESQSSELGEQLKEFIESINKNRVENSNLLQQSLNNVKEQKILFDFELPNIFAKNILESIEQITFFKLDSEMVSQVQQSLLSSCIQQKNPKVGSIMNFLSLKVLFCILIEFKSSTLTNFIYFQQEHALSPTFLKEIEQALEKYSFQFDKIDFSQMRNHLFENLKVVQKNEKSTLANSIVENKTFKKISNNSNAFAYLNFQLNYSMKYILHFGVKTTQGNCNSSIGLASRHMNEDNWLNQESFNYNFNSTGKVNQIIKGTNPWVKRVGEGSVEVRICLEEQLFQVIDLPSRQNIIQLPSTNQPFKSFEQYFLTFYIYSNNDLITLKDFQIVEQFAVIEDNSNNCSNISDEIRAN